MDTVTAFARRQESVAPVATATLDANRSLAVTATYLLSEEGRKASLLAGGDGRAMQQLTVQVPTNRLHLVAVDTDGVARLKLRPRFRADLRARREQNQQQRTAQLALHEEKKRFIGKWVAAKGTPEQQGRQTAGVLPMEEVVEAMTDEAFGVLRDRTVYTRDGIARLEGHLRQCPDYADAVVTAADLVVTGSNTVQATAAQWALVQELQAALPDASVTLRVHKVTWKGDPTIALRKSYGVLVTQRCGPFT